MTESRAQVEEAVLAAFETSNYADASVVVAVPDATRDVEFELMLPPLFEQLREAEANVQVRVALGLHRLMTDDELRPLTSVCERYDIPVHQHDPRGDDLMTLSEDVSDRLDGWPTLPARFPRSIVEADRLICVGSVEPHQYAGYSGGIKTVAIGCAGQDTIDAMHGLEFLRMPGTTVGRVDDNPFQEALWRLGAVLPPADALMFVPSEFAPWHDVHFGRAAECFARCRDVAEQVFFRLLPEPQDWLHLPVTGAKSVNFYQASRAATYAALVHEPAVRKGGLLILEADCPEGVGRGSGERACAAAMERGVEALMYELHGNSGGSSQGGQQRAYVLARALQHCSISLVGAPDIEPLDAMGIRQFESVEAALDALEPGPKGRTVDNPTHRIARLSRSSAHP